MFAKRILSSRPGLIAIYMAIMIICTAVVMPGYVRHIVDSAVPHQDIYFNMWRVAWFAHAIATPDAVLWNANIFSPERWTLAMSDAVPVQGVVATVLLWLRLPPVFVQNLLVLGAMVGSGVAMASLARYLTGSAPAGAIAGLIFAFAPYRIEHVMHLELQWAMWIPLTFLALHVAVDRKRPALGLVIGACVALQLLSCVYYGVFLAVMLAVAAPLVLFFDATADRRASVLAALALAACVAGIVATVYARPYRRAEKVVGLRPAAEVVFYSARVRDYLAVPDSTWLYRGTLTGGAPERRLFIGAVAMLLAVIGLARGRLDRRQGIYLCLGVFALAMSLGVHGYLYRLAREWLLPFRGLRAPARFAIMTLFCASVLAAYGYAWLAARWPRGRYALAGVIACAVLVEYHVALPLTVYANEPPGVYRILARLPKGTVAEFPMPLPDRLPGNEAEYQYMSTFHWNRLVNGYSGTYPPSYLKRLVELRGLPDDRSVAQLRRDEVAYVVVHVSAYDPAASAKLLTALDQRGWPKIGAFNDGNGDAILFALPR